MQMSAAAMLKGKLRKRPGHEHLDIALYGCCLRLIDPYACLIKPAQCACADASNNYRINALSVKGFDRVARPMRMVLVPVVNYRHTIRFCVHNNEHGCRAEMIVNPANNPFVILHGKTYFHFLPPSLFCFVHMHII